MTSLVGKTRTRAHVLADLSINYAERQILLCGFSVERIQHDYGYDLTMNTFSDTGEFEPGGVYIQVKATDRLLRLASGESMSWPVSRRDLKLWIQETYPVILVLYDGQHDKAYWLHIQAYFADGVTNELFAGGETVNVHVPVTNRFNPRGVRAIARRKNYLHQLRRKGSRHG